MDETIKNLEQELEAKEVVAESIDWSRDADKDFASAEDCYLAIDNQVSSEKPFRSRFGRWVKAIALTVVIIFVPEQFSWAFNYNPFVLYGNKNQNVAQENAIAVAPNASKDEIISARITNSVSHLLNQIAYKGKTRIELQLTNEGFAGPDMQKAKLLIDSNINFTKNRIDQVTNWLKKPDIHPLNCGVYSLRDILAANNIRTSLEELSVTSLLVDLMSDIVRPGEPKLKTSLYSMSKITKAWGLNLEPVKIAPSDALKLKTPFIANFDDEHFVTVTKIEADKIHVIDIGRKTTLSADEFVEQLSGFVLASDIGQQKEIKFEIVPDSVQAFIWGSKWHDNSENLPGLISTGSLMLSVGIQVATSFIPGLGGVTGLIISLAGSQFAGAMATMCVMSGRCTEKEGMILNIALGAAVSAGLGGLDATGWSGFGNLGKDFVGSFGKDFIKGFAIGYMKGMIQIKVAEMLSNAFGDDNSVLKDAIIGIISSLVAQIATGIGLVALDGMSLDFGLADFFSAQNGVGGKLDLGKVVGGIIKNANLKEQFIALTARWVADETGLIESDSQLSEALGVAVNMLFAYVANNGKKDEAIIDTVAEGQAQDAYNDAGGKDADGVTAEAIILAEAQEDVANKRGLTPEQVAILTGDEKIIFDSAVAERVSELKEGTSSTKEAVENIAKAEVREVMSGVEMDENGENFATQVNAKVQELASQANVRLDQAKNLSAAEIELVARARVQAEGELKELIGPMPEGGEEAYIKERAAFLIADGKVKGADGKLLPKSAVSAEEVARINTMASAEITALQNQVQFLTNADRTYFQSLFEVASVALDAKWKTDEGRQEIKDEFLQRTSPIALARENIATIQANEKIEEESGKAAKQAIQEQVEAEMAVSEYFGFSVPAEARAELIEQRVQQLSSDGTLEAKTEEVKAELTKTTFSQYKEQALEGLSGKTSDEILTLLVKTDENIRTQLATQMAQENAASPAQAMAEAKADENILKLAEADAATYENNSSEPLSDEQKTAMIEGFVAQYREDGTYKKEYDKVYAEVYSQQVDSLKAQYENDAVAKTDEFVKMAFARDGKEIDFGNLAQAVPLLNTGSSTPRVAFAQETFSRDFRGAADIEGAMKSNYRRGLVATIGMGAGQMLLSYSLDKIEQNLFGKKVWYRDDKGRLRQGRLEKGEEYKGQDYIYEADQIASENLDAQTNVAAFRLASFAGASLASGLVANIFHGRTGRMDVLEGGKRDVNGRIDESYSSRFNAIADSSFGEAIRGMTSSYGSAKVIPLDRVTKLTDRSGTFVANFSNFNSQVDKMVEMNGFGVMTAIRLKEAKKDIAQNYWENLENKQSSFGSQDDAMLYSLYNSEEVDHTAEIKRLQKIHTFDMIDPGRNLVQYGINTIASSMASALTNPNSPVLKGNDYLITGLLNLADARDSKVESVLKGSGLFKVRDFALSEEQLADGTIVYRPVEREQGYNYSGFKTEDSQAISYLNPGEGTMYVQTQSGNSPWQIDFSRLSDKSKNYLLNTTGLDLALAKAKNKLAFELEANGMVSEATQAEVAKLESQVAAQGKLSGKDKIRVDGIINGVEKAIYVAQEGTPDIAGRQILDSEGKVIGYIAGAQSPIAVETTADGKKHLVLNMDNNSEISGAIISRDRLAAIRQDKGFNLDLGSFVNENNTETQLSFSGDKSGIQVFRTDTDFSQQKNADEAAVNAFIQGLNLGLNEDQARANAYQAYGLALDTNTSLGVYEDKTWIQREAGSTAAQAVAKAEKDSPDLSPEAKKAIYAIAYKEAEDAIFAEAAKDREAPERRFVIAASQTSFKPGQQSVRNENGEFEFSNRSQLDMSFQLTSAMHDGTLNLSSAEHKSLEGSADYFNNNSAQEIARVAGGLRDYHNGKVNLGNIVDVADRETMTALIEKGDQRTPEEVTQLNGIYGKYFAAGVVGDKALAKEAELLKLATGHENGRILGDSGAYAQITGLHSLFDGALEAGVPQTSLSTNAYDKRGLGRKLYFGEAETGSNLFGVIFKTATYNMPQFDGTTNFIAQRIGANKEGSQFITQGMSIAPLQLHTLSQNIDGNFLKDTFSVNADGEVELAGRAIYGRGFTDGVPLGLAAAKTFDVEKAFYESDFYKNATDEQKVAVEKYFGVKTESQQKDGSSSPSRSALDQLLSASGVSNGTNYTLLRTYRDLFAGDGPGRNASVGYVSDDKSLRMVASLLKGNVDFNLIATTLHSDGTARTNAEGRVITKEDIEYFQKHFSSIEAENFEVDSNKPLTKHQKRAIEAAMGAWKIARGYADPSFDMSSEDIAAAAKEKGIDLNGLAGNQNGNNGSAAQAGTPGLLTDGTMRQSGAGTESSMFRFTGVDQYGGISGYEISGYLVKASGAQAAQYGVNNVVLMQRPTNKDQGKPGTEATYAATVTGFDNVPQSALNNDARLAMLRMTQGFEQIRDDNLETKIGIGSTLYALGKDKNNTSDFSMNPLRPVIYDDNGNIKGYGQAEINTFITITENPAAKGSPSYHWYSSRANEGLEGRAISLTNSSNFTDSTTAIDRSNEATTVNMVDKKEDYAFVVNDPSNVNSQFVLKNGTWTLPTGELSRSEAARIISAYHTLNSKTNKDLEDKKLLAKFNGIIGPNRNGQNIFGGVDAQVERNASFSDLAVNADGVLISLPNAQEGETNAFLRNIVLREITPSEVAKNDSHEMGGGYSISSTGEMTRGGEVGGSTNIILDMRNEVTRELVKNAVSAEEAAPEENKGNNRRSLMDMAGQKATIVPIADGLVNEVSGNVGMAFFADNFLSLEGNVAYGNLNVNNMSGKRNLARLVSGGDVGAGNTYSGFVFLTPDNNNLVGGLNEKGFNLHNAESVLASNQRNQGQQTDYGNGIGIVPDEKQVVQTKASPYGEGIGTVSFLGMNRITDENGNIRANRLIDLEVAALQGASMGIKDGEFLTRNSKEQFTFSGVNGRGKGESFGFIRNEANPNNPEAQGIIYDRLAVNPTANGFNAIYVGSNAEGGFAGSRNFLKQISYTGDNQQQTSSDRPLRTSLVAHNLDILDTQDSQVVVLSKGQGSGDNSQAYFQLTADGLKFNQWEEGSTYHVARRDDAKADAIIAASNAAGRALTQKEKAESGAFGFDAKHPLVVGIEKREAKDDGTFTKRLDINRKASPVVDSATITIAGNNSIDNWGGLWQMNRTTRMNGYAQQIDPDGQFAGEHYLTGNIDGIEKTELVDGKWKIVWDWEKGTPQPQGYGVDANGNRLEFAGIRRLTNNGGGEGWGIEFTGSGIYQTGEENAEYENNPRDGVGEQFVGGPAQKTNIVLTEGTDNQPAKKYIFLNQKPSDALASLGMPIDNTSAPAGVGETHTFAIMNEDMSVARSTENDGGSMGMLYRVAENAGRLFSEENAKKGLFAINSGDKIVTATLLNNLRPGTEDEKDALSYRSSLETVYSLPSFGSDQEFSSAYNLLGAGNSAIASFARIYPVGNDPDVRFVNKETGLISYRFPTLGFLSADEQGSSSYLAGGTFAQIKSLYNDVPASLNEIIASQSSLQGRVVEGFNFQKPYELKEKLVFVPEQGGREIDPFGNPTEKVHSKEMISEESIIDDNRTMMSRDDLALFVNVTRNAQGHLISPFVQSNAGFFRAEKQTGEANQLSFERNWLGESLPQSYDLADSGKDGKYFFTISDGEKEKIAKGENPERFSRLTGSLDDMGRDGIVPTTSFYSLDYLGIGGKMPGGEEYKDAAKKVIARRAGEINTLNRENIANGILTETRYTPEDVSVLARESFPMFADAKGMPIADRKSAPQMLVYGHKVPNAQELAINYAETENIDLSKGSRKRDYSIVEIPGGGSRPKLDREEYKPFTPEVKVEGVVEKDGKKMLVLAITVGETTNTYDGSAPQTTRDTRLVYVDVEAIESGNSAVVFENVRNSNGAEIISPLKFLDGTSGVDVVWKVEGHRFGSDALRLDRVAHNGGQGTGKDKEGTIVQGEHSVKLVKDKDGRYRLLLLEDLGERITAKDRVLLALEQINPTGIPLIERDLSSVDRNAIFDVYSGQYVTPEMYPKGTILTDTNGGKFFFGGYNQGKLVEMAPVRGTMQTIGGYISGGYRGPGRQTAFKNFLYDMTGSFAVAQSFDLSNPDLLTVAAIVLPILKVGAGLGVAGNLAKGADAASKYGKIIGAISKAEASFRAGGAMSNLINASAKTGVLFAGTNVALYRVQTWAMGEKFSAGEALATGWSGYKSGFGMHMATAGIGGGIMNALNKGGEASRSARILNFLWGTKAGQAITYASSGAAINVGRGLATAYFDRNFVTNSGMDYGLGDLGRDAIVGAAGGLAFGYLGKGLGLKLNGFDKHIAWKLATSSAIGFGGGWIDAASRGKEYTPERAIASTLVGGAGGLVFRTGWIQHSLGMYRPQAFAPYADDVANTVNRLAGISKQLSKPWVVGGFAGASVGTAAALVKSDYTGKPLSAGEWFGFVGGGALLGAGLGKGLSKLDGRFGIGKVADLLKTSTGKIILVNSAGAAGGLGMSYMAARAHNEDTFFSKDTWKFVTAGIIAANVMYFGKQHTKDPTSSFNKILNHAFPTTSAEKGLAALWNNPEMFGRMAVATSADFALIMPAWSALTVPVERMMGKSWEESYAAFMPQAPSETQRDSLGRPVMEDIGLVKALAMHSVGGLQNGARLGPLLGVAQMPLSAVANQQSKSAFVAFLKNPKLHSMPATIAQLTLTAKATEAFLMDRQLYREAKEQAVIDAKEALPGYATDKEVGMFIAQKIEEYTHAKANSQHVAFASLMFKPAFDPTETMKTRAETEGDLLARVPDPANRKLEGSRSIAEETSADAVNAYASELASGFSQRNAQVEASHRATDAEQVMVAALEGEIKGAQGVEAKKGKVAQLETLLRTIESNVDLRIAEATVSKMNPRTSAERQVVASKTSAVEQAASANNVEGYIKASAERTTEVRRVSAIARGAERLQSEIDALEAEIAADIKSLKKTSTGDPENNPQVQTKKALADSMKALVRTAREGTTSEARETRLQELASGQSNLETRREFNAYAKNLLKTMPSGSQSYFRGIVEQLYNRLNASSSEGIGSAVAEVNSFENSTLFKTLSESQQIARSYKGLKGTKFGELLQSLGERAEVLQNATEDNYSEALTSLQSVYDKTTPIARAHDAAIKYAHAFDLIGDKNVAKHIRELANGVLTEKSSSTPTDIDSYASNALQALRGANINAQNRSEGLMKLDGVRILLEHQIEILETAIKEGRDVGNNGTKLQEYKGHLADINQSVKAERDLASKVFNPNVSDSDMQSWRRSVVELHALYESNPLIMKGMAQGESLSGRATTAISMLRSIIGHLDGMGGSSKPIRAQLASLQESLSSSLDSYNGSSITAKDFAIQIIEAEYAFKKGSLTNALESLPKLKQLHGVLASMQNSPETSRLIDSIINTTSIETFGTAIDTAEASRIGIDNTVGLIVKIGEGKYRGSDSASQSEIQKIGQKLQAGSITLAQAEQSLYDIFLSGKLLMPDGPAARPQTAQGVADAVQPRAPNSANDSASNPADGSLLSSSRPEASDAIPHSGTSSDNRTIAQVELRGQETWEKVSRMANLLVRIESRSEGDSGARMESFQKLLQQFSPETQELIRITADTRKYMIAKDQAQLPKDRMNISFDGERAVAGVVAAMMDASLHTLGKKVIAGERVSAVISAFLGGGKTVTSLAALARFYQSDTFAQIKSAIGKDVRIIYVMPAVKVDELMGGNAKELIFLGDVKLERPNTTGGKVEVNSDGIIIATEKEALEMQRFSPDLIKNSILVIGEIDSFMRQNPLIHGEQRMGLDVVLKAAAGDQESLRKYNYSESQRRLVEGMYQKLAELVGTDPKATIQADRQGKVLRGDVADIRQQYNDWLKTKQ